MTYVRGLGGQLVLFVLSLLGIGIAIYLTTVHYENVPLVCSASGFVDCARVLSSSYSVVPGTAIPITIPGLFWSIISGTLAFVNWRLRPERRSFHIAAFVWSLVGMLTVFYLVYVEIVQLRTICAWCTALHVIILTIFLIAGLQLWTPEVAIVYDQEEETASLTLARDERK